MTIRVAINGYGRIGRMVLRALYEDQANGKPRRDIKIVAINAMGDMAINAHLTQYDSAHGRFPAEVSVDGDCMVVNGDRIKMFCTRNPAETPWGALGVDGYIGKIPVNKFITLGQFREIRMKNILD